MNRRVLHVLLLLLLAGLSWFWLQTAPPNVDPGAAHREQEPAAAATATDGTEPPPSPQTDAARLRDATALVPATTLASGSADPARFRRAYLLSLDGGTLTLAGRQDVEGDFASPREVAEELWPGMLRCRLLSATGDVLAEELMPAPDQLCAVQDRGKLVAYRTAGPVMFQARLPRVADAVRLNVSRVAARDGTAPDVPIGSIPLTP